MYPLNPIAGITKKTNSNLIIIDKQLIINPYIVFLLIYNIGFAIISTIIYGIQRLILKLSNKEFKKC